MTDQPIGIPDGAAPVSLNVQTNDELQPKMAFALFDGTGAAGDFIPVVRIVAPNGKIAGQAQGDVVAAGESVAQTWFRGLSKSGGGIQFNKDNQGGYLEVHTSGASPGNHGIDLSDNATGNRLILGPTASLLSPGGIAQVRGGSDVILYTNSTFGNISLYNPVGDGGISVQGQGAFTQVHINSTKIGFFAAGAITRPTVVGARGGNAALASLLTALANLGLIQNNTTP